MNHDARIKCQYHVADRQTILPVVLLYICGIENEVGKFYKLQQVMMSVIDLKCINATLNFLLAEIQYVSYFLFTKRLFSDRHFRELNKLYFYATRAILFLFFF